MTRLDRLLTLTLLAGVFAATASEVRAETERVHRVIPFAAGGTLKLKNFSGDVRIMAGDRDEVVVTAVRRAPQDRLDRVKLDIDTSGSRITIDANRSTRSWWWWHNNVVDTDLEVQVPRRTSLDVSVFSSPVTITGVSGTHVLHSFSGELRLRDVSGSLRAKTFGGDIDLDLPSSADRPAMDLESFSGSVDVRMPPAAHGLVNFTSFSGDLTSDLPLMLRSKSGHKLTAELNGSGESRVAERESGNDLRFKTFSGNVHIRK